MRHLITLPTGEQTYVFLPDNQKVEDYLEKLKTSVTELSSDPQVIDLNPKNEHLEEQISAALEAGNIVQMNRAKEDSFQELKTAIQEES